MSRDNDKIKEDNVAVNVPVSNSENNNAPKSEVNEEVVKIVSNVEIKEGNIDVIVPVSNSGDSYEASYEDSKKVTKAVSNVKIKEGNIAVNVPVSNYENNCAASNGVDKIVTKAVSNDQDTYNNGVNSVKRDIVPKPIPFYNPLVRENAVLKAIDFLTAAAVKFTPIERKIQFLREKGLTDQEIQEAINRASVFYQNQNYVQTVSKPIEPPQGYYNLSNTSGAIQTPYESQGWFRRTFWPLTVAATVAYIGYQIYKKYIENWLFNKQKLSLEDRIERIELSLQECVKILDSRQNTFESLNQSMNQSRDFDVFRSELKSIKSLLLNRHQFPPAPVSSGIPQWQLQKNPKQLAELQNKTNGVDAPSVLQHNVFSSTVNTSPHYPRTTIVESTSAVDNDQRILNDLTPNNQNSIKSNDLINNGKDDTNSKDMKP